MHPMFASAGDARAIPVWFVHAGNIDSVRQGLGERERAFINAAGFEPKPGRLLLLPSADGALSGALFGIERPADAVVEDLGRYGEIVPVDEQDRDRWRLAGAYKHGVHGHSAASRMDGFGA